MDTEDLLSPSLLAAFYRLRHNSLFSRTQQPVLHQSLPWATKIWPGKVRSSGRSGVVSPDGVARGKHRDPVVPGNKSMTEGMREHKLWKVWNVLQSLHR